ncbi:hypothetical protein Plhal304r1_c051g0134481 [Plasmopara halstedii]
MRLVTVTFRGLTHRDTRLAFHDGKGLTALNISFTQERTSCPFPTKEESVTTLRPSYSSSSVR